MKIFVLLLLTSGFASAIDYNRTDIFGILGSDFTLAPRANYTVGIGHRFQLKPGLKRRWEVTGTYTYENNGNHGFLRTTFASHSEALGLVRSIHLPGRFTSFLALHGGATEYSGMDRITGVSHTPRAFIAGTGGVGIHIHYRYTLCFTETPAKVQTRPLYWTTGAALNHGWWSVGSSFNRTSGNYSAHLNLGISLSALMSGEHKEHPRIISTGGR